MISGKIKEMINDSIETHKLVYNNINEIEQAVKLIINAVRQGNKVLSCGNGGSAGQAQHFSAELVGRFENERFSIPSISLTTDTSNITAIGNDYGFEYVFKRQVESLGKPGDILIILTTSDYNEDNNHSMNLKLALDKAKEIEMKTIGLLSIRSSKIGNLVDIPIKIHSNNTARTQECHILILHIIAKLIEDSFLEQKSY